MGSCPAMLCCELRPPQRALSARSTVRRSAHTHRLPGDKHHGIGCIPFHARTGLGHCGPFKDLSSSSGASVSWSTSGSRLFVQFNPHKQKWGNAHRQERLPHQIIQCSILIFACAWISKFAFPCICPALETLQYLANRYEGL